MKIEQAQQRYVALKKELGARLFKAAGECARGSIRAQIEVFKAVKGGKKITQKCFVAACAELAHILDAFRAQRGLRSSRYWGKTHGTPARSIYKAAAFRDAMHRITGALPGRAIERAKARRLVIIRHALPVPRISGETRLTVSFTSDPAAVAYSSHTELGGKYTRSSKWRKTDLVINVTMPAAWITRVYKRGLTEIGGRFNLDVSSPLRHQHGGDVTVYAAKWLAPSRGTAFNVVDGFIALAHGQDYHAKTLASAVNGLRRKTTLAAAQKMPRDQLLARAAQSAARVTVSDSLRAGNCSWGTLDFCRRHSIDPAGGVTLAELADVARLEPRPEVYVVIARVLARKDAA